MNTGLPLIPAMTPVFSSGPPSRRARIRLCLGPMFSRTPMIWTLKSSIRVPSKTVRPTPIMPGLIWSRGRISGGVPAAARAGIATARTSATGHLRSIGSPPSEQLILLRFAKGGQFEPWCRNERRSGSLSWRSRRWPGWPPRLGASTSTGAGDGRGRPVAGFGREGSIDLRQDLGRDVTGLHLVSTTPGVVWRDLVIMGMRVGEGPAPAAPGHIRAYDVRSGRLRWTFHTIPWPGEVGYETWPEDAWKRVGGANTWSGISLDAERGVVFAPTGSPAYDFWGGNRLGANLFANCILALDAATGK